MCQYYALWACEICQKLYLISKHSKLSASPDFVTLGGMSRPYVKRCRQFLFPAKLSPQWAWPPGDL